MQLVRLTLPGIVATLLTLAGGSAATPRAAAQTVPPACLFDLDLSTHNTVAQGELFAIVLDANRTTGYSWSLTEDFFGQDIVGLVGHQYVRSNSGLIGAGGKECWVFEAVKPGEITITLQYSRPWETNVPPAETVSVGVTVQ